MPENIREVKEYWNNHPLLSYEIDKPLGSKEFFTEMDRIKFEDIELFSDQYWDFGFDNQGKKLLDIGCGPGFLTRFYAKRGYEVKAIDLTETAVELTKKSLDTFSLEADVSVGNAENLEFEDNSFDCVVSSGVLHHTPDTEKAVAEACRVLKPGGQAKITLYYRNVLLREPLWQVTKLASRVMLNRVPGRAKLASASNPTDFIRIYDGDTNPVGKGYSLKEMRQLLCPPFSWVKHEIHFFPARFMPKWFPISPRLHKFLDNRLGTMIYTDLSKD